MQILYDWLLVFVSIFLPLLLIGAFSALFRKRVPGKLKFGHRLEAVPWIASVGTLMWGLYWGCSPSEMPRPEADGWIVIPVLLSFPISLDAWILMIYRRCGERAQLIMLGAAHLVFQIAVIFVSWSMALKDCI